MTADGLVIIGGSYAGLQIAASARQHGFDGPIRLVSEESRPPYQRPPLSKELLAAEGFSPAPPLRSDAFFQDNSIDLMLGTRVLGIDRAARHLVLQGGARLAYHWLGLATGASARRLQGEGSQLAGVHTVRTHDDAQRLHGELAAARNVVVIGGGFIGLEVAATAVTRGKSVVVLESRPRLLERGLSARMAEHLAQRHREAGVRLCLDASVVAIEADQGRVHAVSTADGLRHPADLVVVGIGAVPNTALAERAGLVVADGIVVDRFGVTSDPSIVAAGDCTRFPSPFSDTPVRLESVQNAIDQGKSAGAFVAGVRLAHESVPWFWSVQYGTRLQMAGLSAGHDHAIVRGDPGKGRFTVWYVRHGRLIAADSLAEPAVHMLARKLVVLRPPVDPERLADPAFDLATLLDASSAPSAAPAPAPHTPTQGNR